MIGLGLPAQAMSARPSKVSLHSLPLMRSADWLHSFPMIFLLVRINDFIGSGNLFGLGTTQFVDRGKVMLRTRSSRLIGGACRNTLDVCCLSN